MHCSSCGREAPAETRYCGFCGEPLSRPEVHGEPPTEGGEGVVAEPSLRRAAEDPPRSLITAGTLVDERFRIDSLIGRGGFGSVYRAWDDVLNRVVALKTVAVGNSSRRFEREAQALAALAHESIVTIFDTGVDDGIGWIAMELVDGQSLADVYGSGPVPWDRLARIFRHVAAALSHAHVRGVVHRDIKPANILVERGERVKVTDFGVARILDLSPITDSGSVFGTLHYLAPELLGEGDLHPSSDIYSLGVCFYEGLTGVLPVQGPTAESVLQKIMRQAPAPLRDLVPGLPPDVRDLVERCLAKRPEDRPSDAREVQAVLDQILDADHGRGATTVRIPLRLSTGVLHPEIEGERKKVALLLVRERHLDELAEKLSDAELKKERKAYLEELFPIVEEHGGRVHKVGEEGFTAVFGLPHAAEDDEKRALRCAEALRSKPMRFEHDARVPLPRLSFAVHMGHAVCAPGAKSYRILADTLRVARRLAEGTSTGDILVSGTVRNATSRAFSFEEVGCLDLGEKESAVNAFRVSGTFSSPQGLGTPLVGRETEMAMLRRAAREALGGSGRIVALTGEAGAGKSRLLDSLLAELLPGDDPAPPRVVETQGISTAVGFPYRAAGEAVKHLLELLPEEGAADGWGLPEAEAAAISALLSVDRTSKRPAAVTGESLDPEERAALLGSALRILLARACETSPVLLCLDDLHWFDPASVEVFRETLADIQGLALLTLVLYRPGFDPGLGSHRSHQVIALGSLPHAAELELARSLLGIEEVPDALRELLEDRCEGNPFYTIEFLRMMEERGLLRRCEGTIAVEEAPAETEIPVSIEGILAARVDRLAPETRRALQMAAVLGREFPREVLVEMWRRPRDPSVLLRELARRGIVHAKGAGRASRLRFDHPLSRDVVYANILKAARRRYHRWAAEAMEELYGLGPEADLDLRAWHWSHSDRPRRAVRALEEAADRNRTHYRWEAALGQYDEALALHGDRDERRGRLLRSRARVWIQLARNDEAIEDLEEVLEIPGACPNDESLYETLMILGEARRAAGRFAEARESYERAVSIMETADARHAKALLELSGIAAFLSRSEEALELLQSLEESHGENMRDDLAAELHSRRGWYLYDQGHTARALEAYRRAIPLYEAAGDPVGGLQTRYRMGLSLLPVGRYAEGVQILEEALTTAEEIGYRRQTILCLLAIAYAHLQGGELRKADGLLRDLRSRVRELSLSWHEADVLRYGATVSILHGRYDEAWEDLHQACNLKRQSGDEREQRDCELLLARLHLECGLLGRSEALCREVLDFANERNEPFQTCEAATLLSAVLLEQGRREPARAMAGLSLETARRFDEPETLVPAILQSSLLTTGESVRSELLEEARARAEDCGRRLDLSRALLLLADQQRRQGRSEDGLETVGRALSLARSSNVPRLIWTGEHLRARLLEELGRSKAARRALQVAASTMREVAEAIRRPELAQAFLAAPRHRRVLEEWIDETACLVV